MAICRREREGLVELENALVLADTATQLLVRCGGEEVWVPLSVLHEDTEVASKGDRGRVVVPEWLAKSLGIIETE